MRNVYLFKFENKKTGIIRNNTNHFDCRATSLKKIREKAMYFKREFGLNSCVYSCGIYSLEIEPCGTTQVCYIKTLRF